MNLSRRGLITIAVVTLLITIVATFPARVAYRLAGVPGVAMSGISGTAWNGTAREASINGSYLRNLSWQFRPVRLFSGELAYEIGAEPVSGFIDAEVAAALGGSLALRELRGSLPASLLQPALQVPGLQGVVNLDFERLELQDGIPVAANGVLQVSNLVVPLVNRDSLGGYKADFATQNNGIVASVEDTDGVVDMAASLHLRPDRSYEFTGLVIAKPNAPDALRRQMRFLGPANARGQHELRLEGQL